MVQSPRVFVCCGCVTDTCWCRRLSAVLLSLPGLSRALAASLPFAGLLPSRAPPHYSPTHPTLAPVLALGRLGLALALALLRARGSWALASLCSVHATRWSNV